MSLGLTRDTPPDDVSRALFRETKRRGYSRAESVACGSTGFQESGLRMVYHPNGKWGGYFQQDTSYPGRDDPNLNILGFLDRLDEKRRNPGASPDPFKNIFWLQQRPSDPSADVAYDRGRKAYYDEIRRHITRAEQIYDSMDRAPAPAAPAAAPPAREPYGLRTGIRITYGAAGFPPWVYALAKHFNVKASTYPGHQETDRKEFGFAPNPGRLNRGIDWSGSVADMQRLADYMFSIRGELEQLIWRNPTNKSRRGVAGGKDVGATAYYDYDGGYNGHEDHVHTRQDHALPVPGAVPPAPTPTAARPQFEERQMFGKGGSPRTRQPINFFIHTEEGNGTAESLARYCQGQNGVSYHYTLRDRIVYDVVDTDLYSWSVLNANVFSINLCFAGSFAGWSREQWLKREGDIEIAAYLAVQDCRKYGIPTTVIAPPYREAAGISDHKYVTQQLKIGNHTDVGNQFPWDVFSRYVTKYSNPVAAQPQSGDIFMALNDAEQREMLEYLRWMARPGTGEFRKKFHSRSEVRDPNEGEVDTAVGMGLNTDGNVDFLATDRRAQLGHPDALARLERVAAGVEPGRNLLDAQTAQAILAEVTAPTAAPVIVNQVAPTGDDASASIQNAYTESLKASLASASEEISALRIQNQQLRDQLDASPAPVTYTDAAPAIPGSVGQVIGKLYDTLDQFGLADALDARDRVTLAATIKVLETKNGAQLS